MAAKQLNAPNLVTVQDLDVAFPNTIASATTIAPVHRMTFLTGTAQLTNITTPIDGHHELVFVFTDANPGAFLTTGNIKRAITPVQNIPVLMEYDPSTAKYWPMKVT